MSRICVYLGSREGNSPAFRQAARSLGTALGQRGHTLVYGGARVGLMGELANAALEAGGRVLGVMPDHLVEREQAHFGLTELIRVPNMHERKATMAAKADAFGNRSAFGGNSLAGGEQRLHRSATRVGAADDDTRLVLLKIG